MQSGSSLERVLDRACAECRRSKSHCDKRVPCTACTKKGVKHLCPTEALSNSEGNRRFWNATVELREKLGELSQRISELEEALRVAHALTSSTQHPLLTNELNSIKDGYLTRSTSPVTPSASDLSKETPRGSLSMYADGHTHYYGPSATAWWFVKNEVIEGSSSTSGHKMTTSIPNDIEEGAASISHILLGGPFKTWDPEAWLSTFRCYLPMPDEAQRQLAVYYEYGAFEVFLLPQQQALGELLPSVYDTYDPFVRTDLRAHHELALLFGVLSIAAILDPAGQKGNGMAAQYHALARAALVSGRVLEHPTCEAIQALLVMATYYPMACPADYDDTLEWALVGLAARLSHTMGLHRDPATFKLSEGEASKRCKTYMAICTYDSWTAFKWNLPAATQQSITSVGIPSISNPTWHDFYFIWKFSFSRECLRPINAVFSTPTSTYGAIMEVDAKIRSHEFPPIFEMPAHGTEQYDMTRAGDTISMSILRTTTFVVKELALYVLHRDHAYLATTKNPNNPLSSIHGASVMACFKASKAMIGAIRSWVALRHRPLDRMWLFVDMLFTAGAALAAYVIRCPNIVFAQEAISILEAAVLLLNELTTNTNAIAARHILVQLHNVTTAQLRSLTGDTPSPSRADLLQAEEMLGRFGGTTRQTWLA